MRSVVESVAVMAAVDDACEKWHRADVVWSTITWVLSHDPTAGEPLTEGGSIRALVYDGSYAHEMPTVYVLYEITETKIDIVEATFTDAHVSSGRA